jgi:hypothetical protein
LEDELKYKGCENVCYDERMEMLDTIMDDISYTRCGHWTLIDVDRSLSLDSPNYLYAEVLWFIIDAHMYGKGVRYPY